MSTTEQAAREWINSLGPSVYSTKIGELCAAFHAHMLAQQATVPQRVLTEDELLTIAKRYATESIGYEIPHWTRNTMHTLKWLQANGYLGQPSQELIRAGDAMAPSTPTVEEIMAAFDGAVEASTEPGDDDETQDWIDIKDVGVEFRSRLTKLLQQKGQPPSSKGE